LKIFNPYLYSYSNFTNLLLERRADRDPDRGASKEIREIMINDMKIIIKIVHLVKVTNKAVIETEKETILKKEKDTGIDSNKKREEEATPDLNQGIEKIRNFQKEEDIQILDHILVDFSFIGRYKHYESIDNIK